MERRNNALAYTLRQVPIFVVGDRAWLHDAASTIRQWVKAGTCAKVLNARFALNWTGPYTIFVIDPCPSGATREGSTKLLQLGLPTDKPGPDAHRCVSVDRCKLRANLQDHGGMPRYLPDGLTQHVINMLTDIYPPCQVTQDDLSTALQRLEVKRSLATNRSLAGWGHRGDVRDTLSRGLWEREMDAQLSRQQFGFIGLAL